MALTPQDVSRIAHLAYRDMTADRIEVLSEEYVDDMLEDKILELGPDRVAAFIGEPIMGAIGVYIPPMSYWPEIERICRKYDVLLVAHDGSTRVFNSYNKKAST